jgi:hypothetical protein
MFVVFRLKQWVILTSPFLTIAIQVIEYVLIVIKAS